MKNDFRTIVGEVKLSTVQTFDVDLHNKVDKIEDNIEVIDNSIGELYDRSDVLDSSIAKLFDEQKDYATSAMLDNYYTKGQDDSRYNNILTELENKQPKGNYALKGDIPSLYGYATENWVEDKKYLTKVPAEYVTETELEGKGYLTEHQSLSDYAKKTDIPVIPTKLSAFNNDEGFIKNTVTDLANYYKKSETYTQDEVNELISKIPKFAIDVVDELPTSEISLTTVYLVKTSETADNMYAEYIYVNNVWEKLGEQKVDLTDYYTKNQIDNFLNEKADKTEIPDMKPYAKISDVDASLAKYASTDSFNALNTEVLKKANKSYVDETFQVKGDYITEIPAEYVTETELEGKGYLTEHQSLTDYAKKTDIVTYKSGNGITIQADNTINALIGKGEGEGSLLGPNATSSTGQYAVSLGYQTIASGYGSHAEGSGTAAYGKYSHAEGSGTTVSGWYSHAEGDSTKASNSNSHAEGFKTTASGPTSHAEGDSTTAAYSYSHAEGFKTRAAGQASHAEGYGTKTSNNSEHASGQYNISNNASTTFGDAGNTLFSVGNGKDASTLHNAFEIRQNGDIYIADSSMGTPYKLQDKIPSVKFWTGTQEEYDAIETKDDNTVYFVK